MESPLFLDLEQVMRLHAIFLAMNGVQIEADDDGLVELTLSVACGQSGKPEIAEFFRIRAC